MNWRTSVACVKPPRPRKRRSENAEAAEVAAERQKQLALASSTRGSSSRECSPSLSAGHRAPWANKRREMAKSERGSEGEYRLRKAADRQRKIAEDQKSQADQQ